MQVKATHAIQLMQQNLTLTVNNTTCWSVPTFQDIHMQQLHNFLYSS